MSDCGPWPSPVSCLRCGKGNLLVYHVCIKNYDTLCPACYQASDQTLLPVVYPKTDHPLDRWMP